MALTQVKTSGIADDAVTTDKMQHATDGTVITYDANQIPVHVGPGNDGQVLTSQGAGNVPQFETLPTSGPTLTGSTNNTVCTVTGANAIAGEANLTFDGTSLLSVHVPSATGEPAINFTNSDTGTGTGNGFGIGINDAESPYIWNRENTDIRIATNGSERLRIDSSGRLLQGGTTPSSLGWADDYTMTSTSSNGITFKVGTAESTSLNFTDDISTYRGLIQYQHDGDKLSFFTGGTKRLVVENAGDVTIEDGNLVVADGHGIDFSATGNGDGSMGNELLDDYEEGTWTAVLGGTSNHSSYNVTANTAYYTKVGRLVTLFFRFEGKDLNNSAAGQLRISGVPYSPATGGGWTSNFTTYNVAFDTSERQQLYISGPNIYGIESANNSSWSDWQVSDFHNSTMYLRCNLTYHTS